MVFTKLLKTNTYSCTLITSCIVSVNIQVSNITLSSENRLKLLETNIGNRFNFEFDTSQV